MDKVDEEHLSFLVAENALLRRRLDQAANSPRSAARKTDAAQTTPGSDAVDRNRRIIDSAVDYAIVATDLSGIVTDWNEAAETIFGWPTHEIVGTPIATLFTPEDVEAGIHLREMRISLTDGKARDERWHLRADGRRFYANGQMTPLLGEDGEAVGFLKILRDRTREEMDRRELEASRERLRFALDAAALVGTWDWDVSNDVVYADARFAALYGIDPARAAAGAPLSDYASGIHPEDRDFVDRAIKVSLKTGQPFVAEYRTVDIEGAIHFVRARGQSFQDQAGRTTRLPGAVVEVTTERRREARQTALLRMGDDLLTHTGPEDYTLKAMQILGETLDLCRSGYAEVDADEAFAVAVGQWTRPGVAPLEGRYDLSQFGSGLIEALRTGHFVIDDVADSTVTRGNLAPWEHIGVRSMVNLSVVAEGRVKVILFLHDTRPRHWDEEEIAFVREVLNRSWTFSQRRRAERALIDAETRLRLAHEAADIGTFDYDLRTDELIWDRRCRAAFGIADDETVTYAGDFLTLLHPEDRAATESAANRALDPSGSGRFEAVYRTIGRDDAVLRWVQANGQTVIESGETVRFVGAVRDVTEEKESEERQKLLTRELQHRVKNTLAMVNALANQTLRRAANAQEGLAAFSARLIALSHAHDILTQTSWTSAPIGAIVSESLATHQTDGALRIRWSGPDVRLTAKQSLALALALHELATNAMKYGALSNEDGIVRISWRIDAGETIMLIFEWREEGGPPVTAPSKRGFGSRLIEQSLALEFGGTVALDYAPSGVVCRIEAPMRDESEVG